MSQAVRGQRQVPVALVIAAAMLNACRGTPFTPSGPSPPVSPAPPLVPEPPSAAPAPVPPLLPTAPISRRTRFLAFGDSITAGTTSPSILQTLGAGLSVSYPYKLAASLAGRYATQTIVIENAGYPGERAENGVLRLPQVLRDTNPEVVILLHGVNDIWFYGQSHVVRTANYLTMMMKDARFAGAEVILCTPLPQRAGGLRAALPSVVDSYNAALRDAARGEGAILVDFARDFGDLNLIGEDGLHPTEAGYDRMAQMLFDVIVSRYEEMR